MKPYLKKIQHNKRAGGVTQAIECLPSKCETLSSNPTTIKNKLVKISVEESLIGVLITIKRLYVSLITPNSIPHNLIQIIARMGMLTRLWFVAASTWNQPKCPSAGCIRRI
jgi:hypothetical protein